MKKLKFDWKEIDPKNFIVLVIAGIINAFGVTIFLFPVKLYDSGISGLSMLLDQITPDSLSLSMFLIILNIPVFLFGLSRQGVTFTVYSIFTVAVYSLMSFLIMNVFPIDVSFISPLAGSDLLLCAIFGGVISGIGSGLTIRFGGAIDGIDVLSVVFAKRIGLSIGSFVLIFNTLLYIVCGITMKSWILPLYSIVTYYIGSKTIDFVVEGIDNCLVRLARCCVPLPGDDIIGFVTRGYGVAVHKCDCPNVKNADPERLVSVHWEGYDNGYFATSLVISAFSRIDLMADITSALAAMRIALHSMSSKEMNDGCSEVYITIDVHGLDHLRSVCSRLEKIRSVFKIERGTLS